MILLNSQAGIPNSSEDSHRNQENMQAHEIPITDGNKCWFCLKHNPSSLTTCPCKAEPTPTKEVDGESLVYRTSTFGCHSKHFPSCQRLHEGLLDLAVEALQDGTFVAVRVGSDSEFAILIKDADGTARSCAKTIGSGLRLGIELAEFVQISRDILESHVDRTAGKTSLTTQHRPL